MDRYKDMKFDGIIGQETVKRFLSASFAQGHVGHAYVFEGERGIGKKTLARAFSCALLCMDRGDRPCGTCKSCHMVQKGIHPDLTFLRPEDGKKEISVEQVRTVLRNAYVKPYTADYKVVIIEEGDALNASGQNALLKLLEEPPSYMVFLLLCENSNKLLPTVLSRSTLLRFTPYTPAQLEQAMAMHGFVYRKFLADFSGNNIGKALMLCQDESFATMRQLVLSSIGAFAQEDKPRLYRFFDLFATYKQEVNLLLDCMLSVFRDVLLLHLDCSAILQNNDRLDLIKEIASALDIGQVLALSQEILKMKQRLSHNVNYNLAVMSLLEGSWEDAHG